MATIAGEIGSGALRPNTTRSRVANAARHDTVQPNRRARSDGAATGSITLSVMRSVLTASEALCEHLSSSDLRSPTAADLYSAGTELAERVRRYQAASRQFVKDWLRDTYRTAWRVDPASGQVVDAPTPRVRRGRILDAAMRVVLAEDQPLHGLRSRFARPGIGIPVTVRTRRHASEDVVDVTRWTASRPMTAIVIVEQQPNDSLRTVRVKFLDPVIAATVTLAGAALPLAADFTAPVAHTLGMERKPAATPYAIRDTARRGTVDGFTALTPYASNRLPLVLLDGAGFSPLMMAQIANEVAGDRDLSRRFQVWLYQYPMVSPLVYAASQFRADFEKLCARLDSARTRASATHAVVVAHGPGAVLAKTLLVDSGTALWDAAFGTPLDRLDLATADRAFLETLFFWQRSERIDRVIVCGETRNADALIRGVGARAVQLLLREPAELREAVERIYWGQKQHLRGPSAGAGATVADTGVDGLTFPEPVHQALSDAATACERTLVSMVSVVSAPAATGCDVAVFAGTSALAGCRSRTPLAALGTLDPAAVRIVLEALRPHH